MTILYDDAVNSELAVVNVKTYGAKGNGITDDTASVKAAFANGNTIYFPSGTYNLSGWTTGLSVHSVTLFGHHARLIGPSRSLYSFLVCSGGTVTVKDLNISKFAYIIDGRPATPLNLNLRVEGVQFSNSFQPIYINSEISGTLQVHNSEFYDYDDSAIRWLNSTSGQIDIHNNWIHDATSLSGEGVWGIVVGSAGETDSLGINISNNKLNNLDIISSGTSLGIYAEGGKVICSSNQLRNFSAATNSDQTAIYIKARNAVISENTIVGVGNESSSGGAITLKATTSDSNVVIAHNSISVDSDIEQGILVEGHGISVIGNILRGNGGKIANGITAQSSSSLNICDNVLTNLSGDNAVFGIGLNGCSNVIINNNIVKGILTSGGGVCGGVRVQGTNGNISISNNHFYASGNIAAYFNGIYDAGNAWETNAVLKIDNNLINGMNNGYYRASSSNAIGLVFTNNIHQNVSQSGIVYTGRVTGPVDFLSWKNNQSLNLTATNSSEVYALYVTPATSCGQLLIQDNVARAFASNGGPRNGWRVNTTTPIPFLNISNNYASGLATAILMDGSGLAGYISQNTAYSTTTLFNSGSASLNSIIVSHNQRSGAYTNNRGITAISGSASGNPALINLLSNMHTIGLINNQST